MTTSGQKTFAFIATSGFSRTNNFVKKFLSKQFPDYKMDLIDIPQLVRANRRLMAANLIHTFRDYGYDLLRGRSTFRDCFLRTPYLFAEVRKEVTKLIRERNYAFTFQTQSLFDLSCIGTPHFVFTDHALMANRNNGQSHFRFLYSERWQELERSIYENADCTFTMSRPIADLLIDRYGCDVSRAICVYAGSNVKPPSRVCRDISRYEKKNILFVGCDWNRKGGPLLVEAFKQVRRKHPEATLTVIGCQPKVNVAGCEILGKLPLQKMPEYFTRASVFCMPSLREPFGIVYVEALQNGLPIVAFDIGAAPDLVRKPHTGTLVPCGDIDGLAKALSNLLDNPGYCRSLAARGVNLAQSRYNWSAVGERMGRHIRTLLHESDKTSKSPRLKLRFSQTGATGLDSCTQLASNNIL